MKAFRKYYIYGFIMMFCLLPADGSGPDEDAPALTPRVSPRKESRSILDGEFKARLHISDHVSSPNAVHLEVQVPSNSSAFPGISTNLNKGYIHRSEVWVDITIRGISVPVKVPSPEDSLEEIEREIERFDVAISYLRHLLLASPYLIVKNPKIGPYNDIVADLCTVTGGQKLDVADAMLFDGHALPDTKLWRWGWRIPKPR